MKAFYKKEGINLDIKLREVPPMVNGKGIKPHIKVVEYSSKGGAYHRVPLANARGYHSHDKLCQLTTHEFSHHFALPDRYQRYYRGKACSKQAIYPKETLMALNGENGYLGFFALRFHEHDISDMLYNICPKTIKFFNQNTHIKCATNYDHLSLKEDVSDNTSKNPELSLNATVRNIVSKVSGEESNDQVKKVSPKRRTGRMRRNRNSTK